VWIALAAAVACAATAFAIAQIPGPSILLAIVGVPLAAYAALASPSRAAMALSLVALSADVLTLGYSIYAIVDALQGAR
jgi:hypothetical protein